MMATDRRCPECHGTRVVRFDDITVACPFHDEPALETMDSAASNEIRDRILEHARKNPREQVSPEPSSWQSVAGDPGHAYIALGRLLAVVCALIVITVVVMVVLW